MSARFNMSAYSYIDALLPSVFKFSVLNVVSLILKEQYSTYQEALQMTGLYTLKSRRNKLCLGFAKKCTKSELTADIFPLNDNIINTRNPEKCYVAPAKTDRLANSAVPFM